MSGDLDLAPELDLTPTLPAPTEGRPTPSPYSFEFTGEDSLRLTVHNSLAGVVVAVHYRMSRPGATTHASAEAFVPSSDRTASTTEWQLGTGYLLNATAFASQGAPRVGQTFVKVEVIRGRGSSATVLGTILQDYVTARQPIAWPGSPLRSSIEGGGVIRSIMGTNPAPGVEISETCPTGARWQLLSVYAGLSTSAAAGNRRPVLAIDSGAGQVILLPIFGTCPPSAGVNVAWGQGLPYTSLAAAVYLIGGLPTEALITAGGRFYTATDAWAAGDDWNAPIYSVREWLEAP